MKAGINRRNLCPWSADGKDLVIEEAIGSKNSLSTISIEGDHEKKVLVEEEFIIANPHISQDGKWMAYFSQESGLSKIWVRSFPEVNG